MWSGLQSEDHVEGVGNFQKSLTYVGSLAGNDLTNGRRFLCPGSLITSYDYLAYTGNRINLYIMDQISTASRSPVTTPGLKFGISVHWLFQGYHKEASQQLGGFTQVTLRSLDWNGTDPIADTVPNPIDPIKRAVFGEDKIEFGAYIRGDPTSNALEPRPFSAAEISPTAYAFPWNAEFSGVSGARNYCIPVVARADFMRVFFWCDPTNWQAPLDTDQVHIWALSGGDVSGSEKM